jgi:hypothetical protein
MSQTREELNELTKAGLLELAHSRGLQPPANLTKAELVDGLLEHAAEAAKEKASEGVDPRRVEAVLGDIRMALKSAKKVNVPESCEKLQAAVEAHLTEDEKKRLQWGGTSRHIVG